MTPHIVPIPFPIVLRPDSMNDALSRDRSAAPRLVGEGEIRVAPITPLPGFLHEHGFDPAEVFTSAGLDIGVLENPDNPVSFAALGRVVDAAARRTNCPHIGLILGERNSMSVLGLVGRMGQNSADVGTAIRNISAYLHVHDRGAVLTLTVSRGVATLGYAIYAGDVPGLPHLYDGAIAIICSIMRELCGARWNPHEVLIQRSAPRASAPYRKFFRAPVRFDADQTVLVFPASVLAQKLERADAALLRVASAEVRALDARADVDLPQRLRRVLRALLTSGRGSRDEVARLVAMHRRTLNRRLAAHGTTFHVLAAEVRYEIARQLLRDTRMPLAQIAATFDYADASAFTRAFRRWSGIAPSAWRAANTGAD